MQDKEEVELVQHPKHYNVHPSGIECINIIQEFPFNIGTAIKHLWRAGLKPSSPTLQDLRKATQYVQFEIERIQKRQESFFLISCSECEKEISKEDYPSGKCSKCSAPSSHIGQVCMQCKLNAPSRNSELCDACNINDLKNWASNFNKETTK